MMSLTSWPGFAAGCIFTLLLLPVIGSEAPQDEKPAAQQEKPGAEGLAEMMEKAKKYTQPGSHHELLERFLGTWDTETRVFMGEQTTKPERGTAECTWLMKGRWLQTRAQGAMMGRQFDSFSLMGYDNFKQSYVATMVSSWDTAMNRAEGDLDPGGEVLILYGTIDEYLTGEHDKMVKLVWRFLSDDEIIQEFHDLPIGEKNTKVVEIRYTRKS